MAEKYGIKTVGAGYAKCITKDGVTMSHEEILQELREKEVSIVELTQERNHYRDVSNEQEKQLYELQ